MILGVSSCSKDNLDERLIGTWESESGFIVIKKDRTMIITNKAQERLIQEGPISTEDGGLLFLKKKAILWYDEDEIISFFDYEIINSEKVRIDNSLFTRRGGIRLRPKEGAVPIGGQRGVEKLEGANTEVTLDELNNFDPKEVEDELNYQEIKKLLPPSYRDKFYSENGNYYVKIADVIYPVYVMNNQIGMVIERVWYKFEDINF